MQLVTPGFPADLICCGGGLGLFGRTMTQQQLSALSSQESSTAVTKPQTHLAYSCHMASRKRRSDTTVVNTTMMGAEEEKTPRSRLKVRIRRFHGVARWSWNAGSEDDLCGICQSAFEGVAPGIKYPGDECPVVFGKCGHAFHLQCVATWLNSSRQTCPICRAEWEYGQSRDQRRTAETAAS